VFKIIATFSARRYVGKRGQDLTIFIGLLTSAVGSSAKETWWRRRDTFLVHQPRTFSLSLTFVLVRRILFLASFRFISWLIDQLGLLNVVLLADKRVMGNRFPQSFVFEQELEDTAVSCREEETTNSGFWQTKVRG